MNGARPFSLFQDMQTPTNTVGVSAFLLFAMLSMSASGVLAQDTGMPISAPFASKPPLRVTPAAGQAAAKPDWKELSPAQQAALKPLAANWASLSESQKRKWLAISKNYPSLPPAEQAKLHSRMAEWVTLSRQQRAQARLNYAETQKLAPAEKAANWEAYQALSAEERKKLAAKAGPKDKGAATAIKPVPAQKLVKVPDASKSAKSSPKLADMPRKLDHNTLLPRPAAEPAAEKK